MNVPLVYMVFFFLWMEQLFWSEARFEVFVHITQLPSIVCHLIWTDEAQHVYTIHQANMFFLYLKDILIVLLINQIHNYFI